MVRLAGADAVLFFGIDRGTGSSTGLHAFDGDFHESDVFAWGQP